MRREGGHFWFIYRKVGTTLVVVVVVVVFLLVGSVFVPVHTQDKRNPMTGCMSKLKQLALASQLYAGEFDDHFARSARLMDDVMPFVKSDYVFHCPSIPEGKGFGYAMNRFLSGASTANPDLEQMHLLYESRNLGRNVSEYLPDMPIPGRHGGKNIVAFADGHVKAIQVSAEGRR